MLRGMTQNFFFYDLETSGVNPRDSRIMQFAGQRTTLDLEPVGDPINELIQLTPDILPDPQAILITGITPQQTLVDGRTEADFLKLFHTQIATPGTIFVGFNTIRFDDEFIRYTLYRNFYDAYEWQWQGGRGKWDLLDVVRMTRALRPDGIEWPFASDGRPANRLELITAVNGLSHNHAHDALSDVSATISVARLIRDKQPKLFNFLLSMREKAKIEQLLGEGGPFVYATGRYPIEFHHTSIAVPILPHPTQKGSVYVYDLRHDPTVFADLDPAGLAEAIRWQKEPTTPRLPVKQLQLNKCPAVAPLGVLDEKSQERIQLPVAVAQRHLELLRNMNDFPDKLAEALRLQEKAKQESLVIDTSNVDGMLYDGFFNDDDRNKMSVVRAADEAGLADLHLDFTDPRLERLLLLYKARQFPMSLNDDERKAWRQYKQERLMAGGAESRLQRYISTLQELAATHTSTKEQYLLQELQLYAESLL